MMITLTSLTTNFFALAVPLSLLLVGIALTFFVILPYKRISSYKKEGVTTYFFPILGVFKMLFSAFKERGDELAELKEASKKVANPKYLVTNVNTSTMIILQDPKYIKEFLLKQTSYNKATFADVLMPLIGNGLVSAEGETWKRHRKIISSSFNFEFLKSNLPIIQNTTKEFFNKLSADDLKKYSAITKVQDITGEIVGRIFFGENLNSYTFEGKSLTLALAEITAELAQTSGDPLVIMFGAQVMKLPLIPRYRKILQRVQNFRKICFEIIKDRKASPSSESSDLLSSLLLTQKSDDVEKRFSDEDIVDEFVTFFIAGMDTTGHLIGMTLYNLTQYPEYLKQLQMERDMTYNTEKEVTTDTLYKMETLHAILKETLRFYTPAPVIFIRRALHDHNLVDLKVKKGDLLAPSFLTPAFDETYFDNPQQFNPSRWMAHESKIDSYAFTPFSAGPRNCIGQHLAIMEAKVITSEFLERFDFDLKEGYKLKMMSRFLYEPEEELILRLRPKLN